MLGDHLGSTSVTANSSGVKTAELRYKAWGETRYSWNNTPTTRRYTGQQQESSLGGADGLYYYGARWFDPSLGRFAQADTIIPDPGNPQAWDRYAGMYNNPVRWVDPTGHDVDCAIGESGCKEQVRIEKRIEYLNKERERCAHGGGKNCPDYLGLATLTLTVLGAPEAVGALEAGAQQLALACLSNPICAALVFGIPGRASDQSDVSSFTARLQELANQATLDVDALGPNAYTARQQAAMANYPNLAAAYRGLAIDARFKQLIGLDPALAARLQTTGPIKFGLDVYDKVTGYWWDLTTSGQWLIHVQKYTPVFGPNGIQIGC